MIWGIVALSTVVLGLLGLLFWSLRRAPQSDPSVSLFQQQLTALQEQVGRAMGDVSQMTGQQIGQLHDRVDSRLKETGLRLDRNSDLFTKLQEKLTLLEATNREVRTVGEDIARLHDIMSAPKLRGNLGELFLEELLSQILPLGTYEMQYPFRSGEKVDAVVKLPQGHLVSIDAKFPLENFQKMLGVNITDLERDGHRKTFSSDLKKHIDQIANKYIRPDEGTLDFALMYIPAENVYYEAILREDQFGLTKSINTYALSKRVVPVSPNSLYAYFQAIVLGLRGLRIESQAKDILASLTRMKSELQRLAEDMDKVGTHLTNAQSAFGKSEKRLDQIQMKITSLEEVSPGPEPSSLVESQSG